ncbi:MAG: response regulator transcription factor [Bdellovibrionales bacterium]|nr:response regulator transcription factor [Bdellovibrionales bacterium]
MGNSQIAVVDDCDTSLGLYQRIFNPIYTTQYFESWSSVVYCLSAGAYQPSLLVAELEPRKGDSFQSLMQSDFQKFFDNRVVIVSSCDDPNVIKATLELGAVDYFVKPVNPWELLVKVDRYLKRNQTTFPFLKWDPVFHQVQSSGVTVTLTSKEFQILSLLNRAAGAPLTREDIIKQTWGGVTVAAKSLDVHLFNLRRKIEPLGIEVIFLRPNYYQLSMSIREKEQRRGDTASAPFDEGKRGERTWS